MSDADRRHWKIIKFTAPYPVAYTQWEDGAVKKMDHLVSPGLPLDVF